MLYYGLKEVSERYHVSKQTILNWRHKKFLVPDIMLPSGVYRYSEELLNKFDESLKVGEENEENNKFNISSSNADNDNAD